MNEHRTDDVDVWAPYHRLRNRFFAAWIGGPAVLVMVVLLSNAVPSATLLIFLAMPVFAVAFLVQSYRLSRWPCPRCGRHFCWRWGVFNPFAERCMHCGARAGTGTG